MSNRLEPTAVTTGVLVLESGLEVTIRVHPVEMLPSTPQGHARARVILDIDPSVAGVESVGEAIMALLYAGEEGARRSREAADRSGRDGGRGQGDQARRPVTPREVWIGVVWIVTLVVAVVAVVWCR